MSTATKPPTKIKLSHKDESCHRLVRLLMRAYYANEHIAVVDCLLDLQAKQANKVTEVDLASVLHLSPKLIREVLNRLKIDQLVKSQQKSEATKTTEELTAKGKRKNYPTRQPAVILTWHIDFEHVVNVVKFRHWDIFEKLNKKVDKSEVFYICPTLECPNHALTKKRSVMDLLLESTSHTDGVFRCELCFTHNTLLDTKQATPLVLVTHAESADATSSASGLGIDPSENLKNKFNKQLGVILEQLTKVDRMLQEEIQNKKEAAEAGASAALAQASAVAQGGIIQFANPAALAAAASNANATAATSGATSTTTGLAPQTSVEDMISVDLTGGQPDAKRVKMDHVISSLTKDVLPWDKKNPLSLQKVEEERKAQEALRSQQQAEEERLKAEAEQKRYQEQFEQQLLKQQTAAAAAQAAAASIAATNQPPQAHDMMEIDEQSGPRVSVGGRMVLLSSITQEEIDQMTPEEFDKYSAYAEPEEF